MAKKFYITTAIDYPNAEPHIGHAYQKIIADILARYNKLIDNDVWFLTGTDEHGKKIQEYAKKSGKSPQQFVDEMSKHFQEAWNLLNIKPSRFIRTTDRDHKEIVKKAILKCNKNGDIYLGKYEGLYCTDCEAYYTEKDLIENKCPIHKKPVEKLEEESYFFRLSKYEKYLLDLYKKPNFILPLERRNEMVNRVKEGLKDLSISRTSFNWGIEFPLNKKHVTYVWFDALFNYISGSGKNQKYWPANIHLLGKDNGWFHSVYWPAFLKSAGYKLPQTVFIHGFLTVNGEKISKSLGNVISPKVLVNKYGADTIRYFVARNFVFGEDGDFSEKILVERNNSELANKLGNLVSRVSALAESHGIKKPSNSNKLVKKLNIKKIEKHIENYELDKALTEIFAFIDICNEYIQNKKPWEDKTKNKQEILYELSDSIKSIAILLSPFIPETSEKISKVFNFKISYKELKSQLKPSKIKKSPILFQKLELKEEDGNNKSNVNKHNNPDKINKDQNINNQKPGKIIGVLTMGSINFNEWEKVDLRVGQILKVEDIEGADKLYKLSVNLGKTLGHRTICAGIKEHYKKTELTNKKIIVISNLAPRMMRGIESQGMILAAVSEDHKKVSLISPEKDVEPGTKIQ